MASLHFLTLCFLILMTSLGDIQSETLMGDKCVYEEVTEAEVFKCKAGKQKAETMQLKHCPDVTGSEFVDFQCKVVIIAECGKSISIKQKNNNIKDVTLQFCSANGSHCSETTHIDRSSAETTTVNERISLNIINNSFTLNISKVQIDDQKEYKFRLHFEMGEGIMVIDLKVVAQYSDLPITMQNGIVGCTTSGGHPSRQVQETSETPKSKHVSVKNDCGSFFDISTLQYLASDLIYCYTLNNTINSGTVCMASENATPKPLRSVNITKNSSIGILMGILILVAVIAVVLYRRKKTGVWPRVPIAYIKLPFPQNPSQLQKTNSTDDEV